MIIKEFQTKQINIIQDDDKEIWFKGHDVATILGYKRPNDSVTQHVDSEDKLKLGDLTTTVFHRSSNLKKNTTFINESGLYSLILRSKLEAAKQFKRWVTKEVLPSIRKTQTYAMPKNDIQPIELRQLQMEEVKMIHSIEGIDSKLKQAFMDRLMNEINGNAIVNAEEQWSRDIVTIVKDEINKNISFTEAAHIGKFVIKKYRSQFNKDPVKASKYVNGNTRKVFAYTKEEEIYVIEWA